MRTIPLGRLLLAFFLVTAARAAETRILPPIVSLQGGTYSVTVKAKDKFTRNTQKLIAQAEEAAMQFCTKQGKKFKLVSATEEKGIYLVGDMAKATIVFKALGADDPEAVASPEEQPKPAATTPYPLYDQLIKLDELHKKGLVTDEEFAAERKRIVERSK